jgi:hypothetical protein
VPNVQIFLVELIAFINHFQFEHRLKEHFDPFLYYLANGERCLKKMHLPLSFWNEFSSGRLELKGFVLQ